jgi:guanine deaminase
MTMNEDYDGYYIQLAIRTAMDNVYSGNGGPFGAVIVTPSGRVIACGNSVTTTNDPTAHAEVNTIREACRQLETFSLEGCILYSSCEPCPMCLGAALWSRVDRIVFAADRHDAADAGFDDAAFYEKLAAGDVAEHLKTENAVSPFNVWKKTTTRTEY